MKRHWIEFQATRPDCPMTFWVHRPADGLDWPNATRFDPPRQAVVAARGYPVFKIEFDGFIFEFASFAEIHVAIKILGKKLMPRSLDLVEAPPEEWGMGGGPNAHWLSRLPKEVKPWKYRKEAVAYFREAMVEFEKELQKA